MVFRLPEVATEYGGLDDAAFDDGSPVSAHVLREMARNGNRLTGRGDLLAQWNAYAEDGVDGLRSVARMFAAPYWQFLLPIPILEVEKRSGVDTVLVRLRVLVEAGFSVLFFVGTSLRPTPANTRSADQVAVAGSASIQNVDITVPVRRSRGELLSVYVRHVVNTTTDTLMDTATYGTPNTGVIPNTSTRGFGHFSYPGATWTNAIPSGGHYVNFSDATGREQRHVPSKIVAAYINSPIFELHFHPIISSPEVFQSLVNATFTIRRLAAVRVISAAVYGERFSP